METYENVHRLQEYSVIAVDGHGVFICHEPSDAIYQVASEEALDAMGNGLSTHYERQL